MPRHMRLVSRINVFDPWSDVSLEKQTPTCPAIGPIIGDLPQVPLQGHDPARNNVNEKSQSDQVRLSAISAQSMTQSPSVNFLRRCKSTRQGRGRQQHVPGKVSMLQQKQDDPPAAPPTPSQNFKKMPGSPKLLSTQPRRMSSQTEDQHQQSLYIASAPGVDSEPRQ